jgi:OOP family OmpA-OmpF porin
MIKSKQVKKVLQAGAIAALLIAVSGLSSAADATKIKGMITAVNGNVVTLKDQNNVTQTITVSPSTKIKSTKGMTGAIASSVEQSALMPGLPITAEVVDGTATKINFKAEDFKTAQQVQAGTETRMNQFGTYETLASADVLFASGSSAISSQGMSDLQAFATKAKATKDYMVIVQGFTDSTGNAAANQALSDKRAAAVTNFLAQKAGLQPGRIKAPDGLGIAPDAGAGSNAGARKVTVKLVVDKGVQAGSN